MKIVRLTFITIFAVSLAVRIAPEALHPFSGKVALFDWSLLIVFIGAGTGFPFGVCSLRIAFGVICFVAALSWGALPFIRDGSNTPKLASAWLAERV
jgi:hypothetical protein